tara:strand:- start:379 stop:726 length:348 start_codon:yes stop_codon:yes gene_type:complete
MEETWNKTPDEILYIAREWMVNALTDAINEPDFYDLMVENLPSPLPKYRRSQYPRWDWSESKVDEATFMEFLGLVEKHISDFAENMWQRNYRLGNRLHAQRKAVERQAAVRGEEE